MLLTAGAQPMIQDKDGKSPLHYAAKAGHMSIKAILLKHGDIPGSLAEGEIHDRYEENSSGYDDNLQSLMEAGGQRELSSGRDGPNPSELEVAFCDAAAAGNADVVQQLLDDHENIKLEKHGTKAMVLAIQREHEEVLEILLREGANPSCPDGSPAVRIPLHRAMRHGNVRIASRLLDSGANLQTRDSHNRTALFETLHSFDSDGVALLLFKGINGSVPDYLGNTVLHKAAERGLLEHTSILINQEMKVDACNYEGVTPLHLASKHGHYHLFRLLIQSGANVNAVTRHTKETPLMYTASAGSIELCQMLLRRGADVNAISSDKKTHLMLAADAGHAELVEDLLSWGADPKLSKYEPRETCGLVAEFRHRLIRHSLDEHDASLKAEDQK